MSVDEDYEVAAAVSKKFMIGLDDGQTRLAVQRPAGKQ